MSRVNNFSPDYTQQIKIKPQSKQLNHNSRVSFEAQPVESFTTSQLKANFLTFSGNKCVTIEKLRQLVPEASDYLNELARVENGKLLPDFLSKLKGLNTAQLKDLTLSCAKLNILDREPLLLLTNIEKKMVGSTKLQYGAAIQDDWLKRTLYNPHFADSDKINTIIRSCKSTEMGEVVKNNNLFVNATPEGNISGKLNYGHRDLGESKAYGLYTNDTQFLSNYELSVIENNKAIPLKVKSLENHGNKAKYNLSAHGMDITRSQLINKALFEKIEAKNNSKVNKTLSIDIESKVRDLMDVRSMTAPAGPFSPVKPVTADGGLILNTEFGPGRELGVKVMVKVDGKAVIPKIVKDSDNTLSVKLDILAGESKDIEVSVLPLLNNKPFVDGKNTDDVPANYTQAAKELIAETKAEIPKLEVSGEGSLANASKVLNRAISDLKLLTNVLPLDGKDYKYIGAGLPRYACLFGRDSIITAREIVPINQELARDTIELLAKYQGKTFEERFKEDLKKPDVNIEELHDRYERQEEAEGKILHELRVGELAREHKIPSTPYYGTVDATPLWLMLISDYHKWTDDDQTVKKLLPNIEKALQWIDKNSADGFLRFVGDHSHKMGCIANQGWKDSHDSIKHKLDENDKITNPEYPIALAEVQAYVYAAKKGIADIYKHIGKTTEAAKLDKEAEDLKTRFNEKYWLDNEKFIAIALDANSNPVPSVSTNGGQCLTTGIVDKDKALDMEKRLMSDDMFSGWGFRTLNKGSVAFDEMSYHNGSVWPHDTSLVGRGLSHKNTAKIAQVLYEAADTFEHDRIPELYAGFQRKPEDKIIQTYPESCSPQAWSSAALLDIVLSSLGIQPDCKNNAIKFIDPVLPEGLNEIAINEIKINNSPVNIKALKTNDGKVEINATDSSGRNLPVIREGNNLVIKNTSTREESEKTSLKYA